MYPSHVLLTVVDDLIYIYVHDVKGKKEKPTYDFSLHVNVLENEGKRPRKDQIWPTMVHTQQQRYLFNFVCLI